MIRVFRNLSYVMISQCLVLNCTVFFLWGAKSLPVRLVLEHKIVAPYVGIVIRYKIHYPSSPTFCLWQCTTSFKGRYKKLNIREIIRELWITAHQIFHLKQTGAALPEPSIPEILSTGICAPSHKIPVLAVYSIPILLIKKLQDAI